MKSTTSLTGSSMVPLGEKSIPVYISFKIFDFDEENESEFDIYPLQSFCQCSIVHRCDDSLSVRSPGFFQWTSIIRISLSSQTAHTYQ